MLKSEFLTWAAKYSNGMKIISMKTRKSLKPNDFVPRRSFLKIESKRNLGQALSFNYIIIKVFSFPLIILRHWSYAWILNFFISLFFLISLLLIFTISEDLHKYLNLFESNPFGFI